MLDFIHSNFTYDRRVTVLSQKMAEQIDPNSTILDIGCGDGQISELIASKVAGSSIRGIDVLERSISSIEVKKYDGITIPEEDNAVDVCTFVDVLHHAENSFDVLKEAARVASKYIVIKDHLTDGFLNEKVLRFMDYVGNERHGVALPYCYLAKKEWDNYFERLNLSVESWDTNLSIYPFWCSWAFDRQLHFIAKLKVN